MFLDQGHPCPHRSGWHIDQLVPVFLVHLLVHSGEGQRVGVADSARRGVADEAQWADQEHRALVGALAHDAVHLGGQRRADRPAQVAGQCQGAQRRPVVELDRLTRVGSDLPVVLQRGDGVDEVAVVPRLGVPLCCLSAMRSVAASRTVTCPLWCSASIVVVLPAPGAPVRMYRRGSGIFSPLSAPFRETRKCCIISLMHDKQDESLAVLIEEFLTARATRKPSPHTLAAYRRDLHAVATLVAEAATPPLPLDALLITDLSPG